jgi:hypothetical protein
MRWYWVLAVMTFPAAALAQTTGPTPEQLRTLQLQLNQQQQQLNQMRLRQAAPRPGQNQQIQSLQMQLDRQQIELQRLRLQQQSCTFGRC